MTLSAINIIQILVSVVALTMGVVAIVWARKSRPLVLAAVALWVLATVASLVISEMTPVAGRPSR